MMRLGRRASLLVAFSLLISAATAHAECAWVLWQESSAVGYAVSWTQQGAWSAEAECRAQRTRAYVSFGVMSQIPDNNAIEVPGSPTRAIVRLLCLPDTIDPRRPNGK
jgi:hypothetical protein